LWQRTSKKAGCVKTIAAENLRFVRAAQKVDEFSGSLSGWYWLEKALPVCYNVNNK